MRMPTHPQVDLPPTKHPADGEFVAGQAFVSRMPLLAGDEDAVNIYKALVQPLVDELAVEAGSLTATSRIVIEMLANSAADYATWTAYARRAAHRADKDAAVTVDRWSKLADRAGKRVLACLEQLRRPTPTAVKISVCESNVNFGQQLVAPGQDVTGRGSRTGKSDGEQ